MRCKTQAIVIHHIDYSDKAFIARVFTRENGYLGFFVRKSSKKKTLSHLQPGSLLDLEITVKEKNDLHSINEMKWATPYASITSDIKKSAQMLFISEILFRSLEDNYSNQDLFDFTWNAFQYLDQSTDYPDFHLAFLIRLSAFYGFFPQNHQDLDASYFDLENGAFVKAKPIHPLYSSVETTQLIRQLVGMKIDENNPQLKASERKDVLTAIVDYFKLHVSGIKEVNSQLVLETVFHD